MIFSNILPIEIRYLIKILGENLLKYLLLPYRQEKSCVDWVLTDTPWKQLKHFQFLRKRIPDPSSLWKGCDSDCPSWTFVFLPSSKLSSFYPLYLLLYSSPFPFSLEERVIFYFCKIMSCKVYLAGSHDTHCRMVVTDLEIAPRFHSALVCYE